jgi:hypothetical protein
METGSVLETDVVRDAMRRDVMLCRCCERGPRTPPIGAPSSPLTPTIPSH